MNSSLTYTNCTWENTELMTVGSKLTSTVTPCSNIHYEKHFIDTGISSSGLLSKL